MQLRQDKKLDNSIQLVEYTLVQYTMIPQNVLGDLDLWIRIRSRFIFLHIQYTIYHIYDLSYYLYSINHTFHNDLRMEQYDIEDIR